MTADSTLSPDLTSIIHGAERPWIPVPGFEGVFIKVLVADERLRQVIFMFRFAPGTVLPRHKHLCHAIGYTLSGEWRYEEGELRAGSVAYEPFGSEHTPSSAAGAEIVTILNSDTDQFIENYMPDGSTFQMDMSFFKLLHAITPEQVASFRIPGV